uniref:C2H2-type domain-containing protein n=1 Tax=Cacopsylla melanoneura TaxID=428564 RepID=A0A8D8WDI0_9HEMI
METNVGDSVKSEDYKQNTTDSQDYKTDESRGATVPYCDKEEMMESTEDEEDNDNYSESDNDSKDNDNTGSEHDAGNDKENENYSFRNVYHQMKMIHSRPVVTNDEHNGGNQNQEQVDGNETQKNHSGYDEDKSNLDVVNGIEEQNKSSYDGGEDNDNGSSCDDSSNETEPGYVDNTDEDADYDPYYEEDGEESEDSEHHRVARHQDNVPRRTTAPKYSSCETEGTVYYCTPCNRRYHTKTGFSQHKRFECGKPPAFQCLICCKEFNRKSSLKRHLRQIHKTNLQVNVNCVVHHDKLSASLGSVVNHANQTYPTVRRYAPRSVSSTSSSSGDERNKYNRPRAYCRQDTDNRSKYNRLSRPPYWREDSDNRPRTYCREDVRTLRHAVIRRHLFSTRV